MSRHTKAKSHEQAFCTLLGHTLSSTSLPCGTTKRCYTRHWSLKAVQDPLYSPEPLREPNTWPNGTTRATAHTTHTDQPKSSKTRYEPSHTAPIRCHDRSIDRHVRVLVPFAMDHMDTTTCNMYMDMYTYTVMTVHVFRSVIRARQTSPWCDLAPPIDDSLLAGSIDGVRPTSSQGPHSCWQAR